MQRTGESLCDVGSCVSLFRFFGSATGLAAWTAPQLLVEHHFQSRMAMIGSAGLKSLATVSLLVTNFLTLF